MPWYIVTLIVVLSVVAYLTVGLLVASVGHRHIRSAPERYLLQDVQRLDTITIYLWWGVLLTNFLLNILDKIVGEE